MRALRRRPMVPGRGRRPRRLFAMDDALTGRTLRALRHRRGWRQADLAAASGIARSVVSELEAGRIESHTIGALRRSVHAAGGMLRLQVDVPGGDRSRLLDADHARLQSAWAGQLERAGWEVVPEATFSVYGERGSIDLLAWHAPARVVLVVELKTVIVDAGDLRATLDRKARLAPILARERGWQPGVVVPALIALEGTTVRRRLAEHAALFARLNVRGRDATRWLRAPVHRTPKGVLLLTKLPPARSGDRRRAGRVRVRVKDRASRSPGTAPRPSRPAGGA